MSRENIRYKIDRIERITKEPSLAVGEPLGCCQHHALFGRTLHFISLNDRSIKLRDPNGTEVKTYWLVMCDECFAFCQKENDLTKWPVAEYCVYGHGDTLQKVMVQ